MGVKVKSKWDDKFWKRIEHDSRTLDGTIIEYGFPEMIMHPEAKVPVAAVAEWNENGVRSSTGGWRIPPRSFLFLAAVYAEGDMDRFNEQIYLTLGLGKTKLNSSLDYVAKELADLVVKSIMEGEFKALKPSTIAKKKSDVLLIETGFMLDAIKGKVIK